MNTFSLLPFVLCSSMIFAQTKTDSVVQQLMEDHSTPADEGLKLISSGEYQQANQYFSSEINKDESDRTAYFNRGVANWALSDTLNACRDWSAVLALGDTAMFNLLESKCHGSMIIADDTIPRKQVRNLFANAEEQAGKNAKTVVEVMPSFPGGQENLFKYISENVPRLKDGKHGIVYVNFLVSPKGKILYPYVTRGLGGTYDKEALKLVRNMPAWKPGKQSGKAVWVRSNVPVRY
jgi:hypothetical protein